GNGNTATVRYANHILDRPCTEATSHVLRLIDRRDESDARLPADLIALARWISSYYCAPIGMTLASMLPAAVKKNIGAITRVMIDLGDPLPLDQKLPPKQRRVLEVLAGLPAANRPIELRQLAELAGL